MKRSKINQALKELEAMCEKYHCYLPPFCHFTPDEWQNIGHEYDEVRDCMLGWDITDYGMGDFDKFGFSLITSRNGNRAMEDKYPKINPIDTTGAGDIFGGSAVSRLLKLGVAPAELTVEQMYAVGSFASTAASFSTEKSGGIPSIPDIYTVEKSMC